VTSNKERRPKGKKKGKEKRREEKKFSHLSRIREGASWVG
jgi:hypothetical protein